MLLCGKNDGTRWLWKRRDLLDRPGLKPTEMLLHFGGTRPIRSGAHAFPGKDWCGEDEE